MSFGTVPVKKIMRDGPWLEAVPRATRSISCGVHIRPTHSVSLSFFLARETMRWRWSNIHCTIELFLERYLGHPQPFTREVMCGPARDTTPWQPLPRVSDSRVGSVERSDTRVIFLSFCVLKHSVLGGFKREAVNCTLGSKKINFI